MKKDAALVLLSGGQDSTTCLAWALENYYKVEAVAFRYGQKHQYQEMIAAYMVSDRARVTLKTLDILTPPGLSALTGKGDLSSQHPYDPRLPASFVPGRNYILLGYAAIFAYSEGIHDLVAGMCETDYSGYPDCRRESINSIEEALTRCLGYTIFIQTPLMHLTKAETVLMMERLGHLDWYKDTHTCYEGLRPPCGNCPACKLRAKGFKDAGMEDPLLCQ